MKEEEEAEEQHEQLHENAIDDYVTQIVDIRKKLEGLKILFI